MEQLSDGSCTFRSRLEIAGGGSAPFAVGAGWLIEMIETRSGDLFFVRDGVEPVRPTVHRFGVYYAKFSIVQLSVRNLKADAFGIGSFNTVAELPAESFLFGSDFQGPFTSAAQAADVLARARDRHVIDICSRPSLLSLKAKRLIDENYRAFPAIGRVAERLGVTHAHLTRQFKCDYRLTPSAYLHRVRAAEASYKLQLGEAIIEVSADVGYNDLSRFYKQFRKEMRTSPGSCRS